MTEYKKKLIEVALPLDAINDASAYDKMPGIGPHPKGVHKWWAPLPLPCARAVLLGSILDDPSAHTDRWPTEADQSRERQRLQDLVRRAVAKGAERDQVLLRELRDAVEDSCDHRLPVAVDPFCGSGAVPVEARRLGLPVAASDLNPIAVLMTRALIEMPARFRDMPPVNPSSRSKLAAEDWRGTQGLAEDVREYANWMGAELGQTVGHLYPPATLPKSHGGGEAPVIAWLWARTVTCPNPACGAAMPLISSFVLSVRRGHNVWIEPVINRAERTIRFSIRTGNGTPPMPPKMGRGARFRCLLCEHVAEDDHIKAEAVAGRMDRVLMAVVAHGPRNRIYLEPTPDQASAASCAPPEGVPEQEMAYDPRNIWCANYGLTRFAQLFTTRQQTAMVTLSDLVQRARERILADAVAAWSSDSRSKGVAAEAYADAVATYLAFAVDRCADFNNAACRWVPRNEKVMNLFARQAIPMVWDYAEANVTADVVGGWSTCSAYVAKCLETAPMGTEATAEVQQLDARSAVAAASGALVSTDPPYYDNIEYANLSDFFYVWLRRSLGPYHPDLFSTILVPKSQELVASPYRFDGDTQAAERHFEEGFLSAFVNLRDSLDERFPITVYYAFKQSEHDDKATKSRGAVEATGWATMLQSLISAGFTITATWPVRASQGWRIVSMGTNALASYIVIACRQRPQDAPLATRREFMGSLKEELPSALLALQRGNIAPVDLAQASIGPGMAVFSRFSKVVETDGSTMPVRTALALINQALDEVVAEQEGEFEADTRWAIAWFAEVGHSAGDYGRAELLSKAKNTSVSGMVEAGILEAKAGRVRLLRRDELDGDWDPATDKRLTVWETTQHLIGRLDDGEAAAATLARQLGAFAEVARDLAYRLFLICERKKMSQEAQAYNSLVIAWPEIQRLAAAELPLAGPSQTSFEV